MPTPGVMKVRIGTDTQTNTPVKQVAFRFNGMSGPGPASSDQNPVVRAGAGSAGPRPRASDRAARFPSRAALYRPVALETQFEG